MSPGKANRELTSYIVTTVKTSVFSGIKWVALSQGVRQIINLLTTLLLARLLAPSDFGLMGMSLVVTGFLMIFSDLGTSAAVINKEGATQEFLSSIFWLNVGFGALVASFVYLFAPIGAEFYAEPRVTKMLEVTAVGFIFSGFGSLHQALLERSFAFTRLAMVEIISVVFGAIVGITLAIWGAGVWSLLFQSLAMAFINTCLLWYCSSWRPAMLFHWSEIKPVSGYSLNLVGFTIFNYLTRNVDNILIGRFLGAQDLGYYTLAYRILLLPLRSISAVIGRVMFPIYSSIKDDSYRFAKIYLKIVATIALITFPLMMGIMALASPLVMATFGEEWQSMVILIVIFAPLGLTQSIGSTVGLIYLAKGRTDWMFRWGIVSSIIMMIAFCIGLKWGIIGVASAYLLASLCLLYPSYAISFSLIELKFFDLLDVLWRPLLNSLLMLGALYILGTYVFNDFSALFVLSILIPTGMCLYLLATWLNNRKQLVELWIIAKSIAEK